MSSSHRLAHSQDFTAGFCDLILVLILVTDISRIDSFGYKACQKDEVQNRLLLTGATHALQEDVQG